MGAHRGAVYTKGKCWSLEPPQESQHPPNCRADPRESPGGRNAARNPHWPSDCGRRAMPALADPETNREGPRPGTLGWVPPTLPSPARPGSLGEMERTWNKRPGATQGPARSGPSHPRRPHFPRCLGLVPSRPQPSAQRPPPGQTQRVQLLPRTHPSPA